MCLSQLFRIKILSRSPTANFRPMRKQLNTTKAKRMITLGVDMVLLDEHWGSSGKMVSL